jgi:hypothetical protein
LVRPDVAVRMRKRQEQTTRDNWRD